MINVKSEDIFWTKTEGKKYITLLVSLDYKGKPYTSEVRYSKHLDSVDFIRRIKKLMFMKIREELEFE